LPHYSNISIIWTPKHAFFLSDYLIGYHFSVCRYVMINPADVTAVFVSLKTYISSSVTWFVFKEPRIPVFEKRSKNATEFTGTNRFPWNTWSVCMHSLVLLPNTWWLLTCLTTSRHLCWFASTKHNLKQTCVQCMNEWSQVLLKHVVTPLHLTPPSDVIQNQQLRLLPSFPALTACISFPQTLHIAKGFPKSSLTLWTRCLANL